MNLPFGRFMGYLLGLGKCWQSLWPKGPAGLQSIANGRGRPEAKQRSEKNRLDEEVLRPRVERRESGAPGHGSL